jgi:hypothetical protein
VVDIYIEVDPLKVDLCNNVSLTTTGTTGSTDGRSNANDKRLGPSASENNFDKILDEFREIVGFRSRARKYYLARKFHSKSN